MPSLVEIGPVVLELKIFEFRQCIFDISNHFLKKLGLDPSFNKFKFPYSKDALCQVWLKLAQWFLRRFLKLVNVLSLFPYYLPLEKGGVLNLNKFEFPLPKNALCQVWLKLVL